MTDLAVPGLFVSAKLRETF